MLLQPRFLLIPDLISERKSTYGCQHEYFCLLKQTILFDYFGILMNKRIFSLHVQKFIEKWAKTNIIFSSSNNNFLSMKFAHSKNKCPASYSLEFIRILKISVSILISWNKSRFLEPVVIFLLYHLPFIGCLLIFKPFQINKFLWNFEMDLFIERCLIWFEYLAKIFIKIEHCIRETTAQMNYYHKNSQI